MKNSLSFMVAMLIGAFVWAGSANAQCDADYIAQNISGVWKVNNANGQGFGGDWGGYRFDKPQVTVELQRGAISLNGSRPFAFGYNFSPAPNRNGGYWCSFTVGGQPARLAYASNRWWIFEIGPQDDRNRIEMIRR